MNRRTWTFFAQLASVLLIWVFVAAFSFWVIHLLFLAVRLRDVPSASMAISFFAIPVFITIASVLTYVFVGIQRARKDDTE